MIKSPCKDCPDRMMGCHSICRSYKAFEAARKKELYEGSIRSRESGEARFRLEKELLLKGRRA